MNRATASLLLAVLLASTTGCTDPPECVDESIVVEERGTCAPGPVQVTLSTTNCHVFANGMSGPTGLPVAGGKSANHLPLRQGEFMLFTGGCGQLYGAGTCLQSDDVGPFRLCRARRVDYRLEVSCVDGNNAPVCDATFTEP